MKTFISLLSIALIVGAGVFVYNYDFKGSEQNTPRGFTRYQNDELGFSILRPEEIQIDREGPNSEVVKFTHIGPDAEPQTEITDGYTVSIRRDSSATTTSLDQYLDQRISEIVELSGPLNSNPEPMTLGGMEVYKLTYQGLVGGDMTEYILIGNDHAYSLTYFVADPNNRDYESTVQTMVESFEIK